MTFTRDAVNMKKMPVLDGNPVNPKDDISSLHYFHTVREYAIGILQNRAYSLDDRLVLLGLLHKRFADALAENPAADLAAIQFNFEAELASGAGAAALAKLKPDPFIQTKLTKELVDEQIRYQRGTPRYKQLIGESLYGLGSFTDATMQDVAEGYAAAYRDYYAPFMEEHGYLVENFLVNEYFRQRMPFGKFKGIWDSYVFLCVLYAVTRMHLVGLSGFHKGLDGEKVALLASALSREIMHNAKFIDNLIELLTRSDALSLAHMVMLVKPPSVKRAGVL
jgi:lysine-N-methylase